jgi:hypothetical protein
MDDRYYLKVQGIDRVYVRRQEWRGRQVKNESLVAKLNAKSRQNVTPRTTIIIPKPIG